MIERRQAHVLDAAAMLAPALQRTRQVGSGDHIGFRALSRKTDAERPVVERMTW